MRRNEIISLCVTIAIFATVVSFLILKDIVITVQAIEVTILFVLVLVTIIYAKRTSDIADATKQQANASVKMAEEMKKQRHDTVRPVIDIQREQWDEDKMAEAIAAREENTSRGLSCVLENIGLGPALDVYSFVQNPSGERQRHPFGTLATGGKTYKMNLSLNHEENRMALVAYYKDVYGRAFESRREVGVDKEKGWELDPLQVRLVEGDENHD